MFEFSRLPQDVVAIFHHGPSVWQDAVRLSVEAGILDIDLLTDLAFYMHHPERMDGPQGRPLDPTEPEFDQLVTHWQVLRSEVIPIRFRNIQTDTDSFGDDEDDDFGSDWVVKRKTRRQLRIIGGADAVEWAKRPPVGRAESIELRPAHEIREQYVALLLWKSADPATTCLAASDRSIQSALLLRDDIGFWRARTNNEMKAQTHQAGAAGALRAYRQHIVVDEICPVAAKLKETDVQNRMTFQLISGLLNLIPTPSLGTGIPREFSNLRDLLTGIGSALASLDD